MTLPLIGGAFSPAFRYWGRAVISSGLGVLPSMSCAAWIKNDILCLEEAESWLHISYELLQAGVPALHRVVCVDQKVF